MSLVKEPQYPDVRVTLAGTEGNAYGIIATVSRQLRRIRGVGAEADFKREAQECESYDALIQLVLDTVTVE